jgi:hypothetical protein
MGYPVNDGSGESAPHGSGPFEILDDVLHGLDHERRCRGLRCAQAVTFRHHDALFGIHEGSLDARPSDVDSEYLHGRYYGLGARKKERAL